MANYGLGAKAGLIAGIIEGAVIGILSYIVAEAYVNVITSTIQTALPPNSPVTANDLVPLTLVLIPIASVIGGVISGLILGLIFAAVYDKFMRNQSIQIRGVVFGIILFVIDILLNIGNVRYGGTYFVINVGTTLLAALLYGYLLGYFFVRFSPNQHVGMAPPPPPPPPPSMP